MMNSNCDENSVNSFDDDQYTNDESTGVTTLSVEELSTFEGISCIDSVEQSHQVTGPGQLEMAPAGKISFTNDTDTNNQPVCFSRAEIHQCNV